MIRDAQNSKLNGLSGDVATAPLRRADYAVAAASAIVALAVYVRTVAPTVTGEDSGELIAAAYTLGIPHPTGYPLWCILGKFSTWILPFGSVAWRVNMMSAVCAAATVFTVSLIIAKLTRRRIAAAGGALALAFSFEFWEQSVIAEVYTLNGLLVAVSVMLILVWRDARQPGLLYLFSLIYGLGLCNHSSIYLLAPVFAAFLFGIDGAPWKSPQRYAVMLGLMILGWSVHLYLPIRSMANPPIDWGNPETFRGFWDVITRRQYQFILAEHPRGLVRFAGQTAAFLRIYAAQFTPLLCWVPLVGAFWLWRRDRACATLLVALVLVSAISGILVPNFGQDRLSLWINTTYWLHTYVLVSILFGVGIDWFVSAARRNKEGWVVGAAVAVAGVACPLVAHFSANDKSEYYFASDYADNILATLDENAIYFGDGDHAIFPIIHQQIVEGHRPDVLLANPYGYPLEILYEDMPADKKAEIHRIPTEEDDEKIVAWVLSRTDRPVYFLRKPPRRVLAGKRVVNAGLLYRVVDGDDPVSGPDYWDRYTWHSLDASDAPGDWSAELILYDYHFARARSHLDEDDLEDALAEFGRALDVAGETKERLNDFGSACADSGRFDHAEAFYLRALELDPEYEMARRNLDTLRKRAPELTGKAQDRAVGEPNHNDQTGDAE